jgi:hypothetical protein
MKVNTKLTLGLKMYLFMVHHTVEKSTFKLESINDKILGVRMTEDADIGKFLDQLCDKLTDDSLGEDLISGINFGVEGSENTPIEMEIINKYRILREVHKNFIGKDNYKFQLILDILENNTYNLIDDSKNIHKNNPFQSLENKKFHNNKIIKKIFKILMDKKDFAIDVFAETINPNFEILSHNLRLINGRFNQKINFLTIKQCYIAMFYELKLQKKYYEIYIKFLNDLLEIVKTLARPDDQSFLETTLKKKMFTLNKINNYSNISLFIIKTFEALNKYKETETPSMEISVQPLFNEIKNLLDMESQRMAYGEERGNSAIKLLGDGNNEKKIQLQSNVEKYGYIKRRIINIQESIIFVEKLNVNLNNLKLKIENNKENEQDLISFFKNEENIEFLQNINDKIERLLKTKFEKQSIIEQLTSNFGAMNLSGDTLKKTVDPNNFPVKFEQLTHIQSIIKKLSIVKIGSMDSLKIIFDLDEALDEFKKGLDYIPFLLMRLSESAILIKTSFNKNDSLD